MHRSNPSFTSRLAGLVIICFFVQLLALRSQEPNETLRISTRLAETDVLVLNKQGEFVEGLKSDQFELRINGKRRGISFFDQVMAGSASEEDQIAVARGKASTPGSSARAPRGRTILFYLDDYHLSVNSITRMREMLTNFVDSQMAPEDQVALITASGQLGFLEQFVREQAVLHRAIGRLVHRNVSSTDAERTPMSESEAAAIYSNDRRVIDYYVDQLLRDMGRRPRGPSLTMKNRLDAEAVVKARAKSIIDQSTAYALATLSGLEKLMRLIATMPWRKTLFFVSDGFIIHDRSNSGVDTRRVTQAAAHAGTVIYSVDARGLSTGMTDASRKITFDVGRMPGTNSGALTNSQEPLQTLAVDTAGRAILNTNEPRADLARALKETANYYLLSWRPEENELSQGFHSMEINIVGRPDLVIRIRHGRSGPDLTSDRPAIKKDSSRKKNEEQVKPLPAALQELVPRADLPVFLSVGYSDAGDNSPLITTTVEVPLKALQLSNAETTVLDVLGAGVDESGKRVSVFDQGLTVKVQELKASKLERIVYSHQFKLSPGLYQIRVAVQERASNRIGGAVQWIDVPPLTNRTFSLSSLFIGEVDAAALVTGKLSVNASHRVRAGSTLGFFCDIYNATSRLSGSDLALQIQIFRDQQPVITKPLVKVDARLATDPARIPYGEDLSLAGLPVGKYLLAVTVIDRISKKTAQQKARFTISQD